MCCVELNALALVDLRERSSRRSATLLQTHKLLLRSDTNWTNNQRNRPHFCIMELRIIFPVLSVLSSGIFHTAALPARSLTEGAATPGPARHSRTKRCSCASFLDKECVYFCHLDIIWVNTPERTVSYGLGNAPRRKRSAARPASNDPARCRCADSMDGACASFCHTDYPARRKAAPDKVIPTACGHDCAKKQRKHDVAAQTRSMKRVHKSAVPSLTTKQIRLLLEKWRFRRFHKAQAWVAENTMS
ncbi:endothelin-1 [Colossoma macropomum]|uniref:endothelin-1 n=1 Tax=Colossoma macropomum TaxID=42526 RepID=UPI00186477B8|nr:endothelin-1 [Colossoma macropomum]